MMEASPTGTPTTTTATRTIDQQHWSSISNTTIPTITPRSFAPSVRANSTTLYFKRFKNHYGKLRLSLQNISSNPLHYKIKKSAGTKLLVEPHGHGLIDKRSDRVLIITWNYAESTHSSDSVRSSSTSGRSRRHQEPYARLILHLALNGKFDDPRCSTSTRILALLAPTWYDEYADADVLIVDSPKLMLQPTFAPPSSSSSPSTYPIVTRTRSAANQLSSQQSSQMSNPVSSQVSLRSASSIPNLRTARSSYSMEQLERDQFTRWLILYFILILFLGLLFHQHRSNQQFYQKMQQIDNI